MSHAVAEIAQMGDKHKARATELIQGLSQFSELAVLLERYEQHDKVCVHEIDSCSIPRDSLQIPIS